MIIVIYNKFDKIYQIYDIMYKNYLHKCIKLLCKANIFNQCV